MSTIQIADKTTLDNTKTNTTNLLNKGGIQYNATSQKYQTYNTTNNSWVDTEFGGGGNPTIVVKNTYNVFNNINVTVSNTTYRYSSTKSMGTGDSITFEVPYCGDYSVTCNGITKDVSVDSVGGIVCNLLSTVAFADISDAELASMLNAHYNDLIDIKDYWAVGDTRTISLSAMSATSVGESHVAQDVEMVILGFEIDDLKTSINGHTKAAITIGQVDCLKENGYMNSTHTNSGSWNSSARRTWCNEIYYNALPSDFKSMVKQVNKITASEYNSPTNQTTQDYCFLLAVGEVLNNPRPAVSTSSSGKSVMTEYNALTTYPYYETAANRIKDIDGTAINWWERSPYYGNSMRFCCVKLDGSANFYSAANSYGIAPAMCL